MVISISQFPKVPGLILELRKEKFFHNFKAVQRKVLAKPVVVTVKVFFKESQLTVPYKA